jgi:type III pantothenate kinase
MTECKFTKKQPFLNNFVAQNTSRPAIMNLCIDIGNTSVKAAIFDGNKMIPGNHWQGTEIEQLQSYISGFPRIRNAILCSVRSTDTGLIEMLQGSVDRLIVLDEFTPLPFRNLYETAGTLGKDRLAAVAGANNNYPGRNVLVIDAGTAITYDVINDQDCYLGGNISPGLAMRLKALHSFTVRLPLVKPLHEVPLLAKNTEEAIAAGVQNGIIFEMEAYIDRLNERLSDLVVIITGGDAGHFDKKLKNTIFAHPELILTGLNRILTYNVDKR